ncbi:uncharacterized protein LOC130768100 [Actinidia eriantha]|uniref:uncharacterized protein LOC130768100 n=1 Tax=Actinidia eriantha TaxID=165200 RepID=UPI002583F7A7|nr:uncharacterized protein LOC130768100 [Actinidia eriantha]
METDPALAGGLYTRLHYFSCESSSISGSPSKKAASADQDHSNDSEKFQYAHCKCVQRWCNEKGHVICEICHQQFKPDYTAPPPLFCYGGIPMNFRGNWEVSRRDLHNSQFIDMVAADRNFLDPDFDDYPAPTSRSLICCRLVAIIFMVLLVLRHTLPIIIGGAGDYTITLIMEARNFSLVASDEENELPQPEPQPHLIRVQCHQHSRIESSRSSL